MNVIKNALTLLKKVGKELNIEYNSFYDLSRSLKNNEYNKLDVDLRNEIKVFLESINLVNNNYNVAMLLGVLPEDYNAEKVYSLNDLNDVLLVKYFGSVIYSVSLVEKDDLLLLKYNECIFNTGWHDFAKMSRGKVVNKNTFEIVSYPFNKFFNLDENEDSRMDKVRKYINEADYISVTDKKDGSTIIVSNYNGKLVMNTNGSLENEYIDSAKNIFDEKYNYFINNVPEGYTFVFELIDPDHRIILDYGDERNLYLLAVRDLSSFKLLKYDELKNVAEKYSLNLVEDEAFNGIDELMERAVNLKNANKEGWVIRLVSDDFDFMFKLKLEEYFLLHKMKSVLNIKKVYNAYLEGNLDDLNANADDKLKDEIAFFMEEINMCFNKSLEYVKEKAHELLNKNNMTKEDFLNNREKMVELIKMANNDKIFGYFIVRYLKTGNEDLFGHVLPPKFYAMYDFFNENN